MCCHPRSHTLVGDCVTKYVYTYIRTDFYRTPRDRTLVIFRSFCSSDRPKINESMTALPPPRYTRRSISRWWPTTWLYGSGSFQPDGQKACVGVSRPFINWAYYWLLFAIWSCPDKIRCIDCGEKHLSRCPMRNAAGRSVCLVVIY